MSSLIYTLGAGVRSAQMRKQDILGELLFGHPHLDSCLYSGVPEMDAPELRV